MPARLRLSLCLALPFVGGLVACGAGARDGVAGAEASQAVGGGPSCDVRDYGAVGDGTTNDTAAIQAAIDACAGKGGEVHLRSGVYKSGTLRLGSSLTFHVHGGATLLGSQDDADYPDTNPPTDNTQLRNCKKALLYAESVHDLHVTGAGTIDGNGTAAKWLGSSKTSPEYTRPMAIFFVLSTNVSIENVTVKSSAMWSVVNMDGEDLTIRNVTVSSTQGGTRDGIDVVDMHHVLVEGCTIASEDDAICLKSGSARGVDDVTVRNCHVQQSGVANGLKLGTASYGSFTNVTFDGIDVHHVDKAAMAVESVDGALVQNVVFRNVTVDDVGTLFFVLIGDRGLRPAGVPRRIGSVDGVRFENVTGGNVRHEWGSALSGYVAPDGSRHPITNVTFDGVNVTTRGGVASVPADPPEYAGQYPDPNLWGDVPGAALWLRHVDAVTVRASTFAVSPTDARPQIASDDVGSFAAN